MNPPPGDSESPASRLLRDPAEKERLRTTLKMLPADCSSLLDVGCGSGAFLRLLRAERAGLRTAGVDRSPSVAAAVTASGAPCLRADSMKLPFADAAFHCASALEILEHLEDNALADTARELSRVASKRILVSTPHEEELIRLRCAGCGRSFNPNGHVRRWDERALKALFGKWTLTSSRLIWAEKRPYLYRELHGFYARIVRPRLAPAHCLDCAGGDGRENCPPAPTPIGKFLWRALPGRVKYRWIACLFTR